MYIMVMQIKLSLIDHFISSTIIGLEPESGQWGYKFNLPENLVINKIHRFNAGPESQAMPTTLQLVDQLHISRKHRPWH